MTQAARETQQRQSYYRPQTNVPDAENFSCFATLDAHKGSVTSIKFSPAGGASRFVSGSADATARLWDTERGAEIAAVDCGFKSERGAVACVDVSKDGATLVTSSDDFNARLWDTRAPHTPVQVFQGHKHVVSSCSFAPNGNTIATGSFDETVKLWDQRMGKCDHTIAAHTQPVTCVQFSKGSVRPNLATTSMDGTCRIWSSHSRECLRTITPLDASQGLAPVASVRFTPNNQYVLLNSLHNKILLFDPVINSGTGTSTAPAGAAGATADAAVLPVLKKSYEGHLNTRSSLRSVFMTRCSDGAKLVLSGSEDHHVYVWNLNSRDLVGVLRGRDKDTTGGEGAQGHSDAVVGIDASEVASIVVTGSKDTTVKVWKRD